jgi:hypothetical protein
MPMAFNPSLRRLQYLLITILMIGTGAGAHAARYVAFDVKHSSGDFGGDVRTSATSLNLSAGITTLSYDADVTIPFVSLDTQGADTESGIGDIVVRGGHRLLSNKNNDLFLYGSLAAKLATADENAGLGTGENDYAAYLDVYKNWQKQAFSFYGGYRINGDPPGVDLKDVFSYGAGWSRYFSKSSFYLSLEGQQTAIEGVDDPLEFHTGLYHILSPFYMIRAEVYAGLSEGSPDYGMSAGFVRVF